MKGNLKLSCVLNEMKTNDVNYIEVYGKSGYSKKKFSEVYVDVLKTLVYLRSIGAKKGSRIGIIGINSYEYLLLDLTAAVGGFVSVPFPEKNYGNRVDELKTEFDLAVLFSDENYITDVNKGDIIGISSLMGLIENADIKQVEFEELEEEDIFTIIFTSGTTGRPKGIGVRVKCVEDWMENLVDSFEFTEDDKIIDFFSLSISNARLFVYASILIHFNLTLTNTDQLLRVLALAKPTIMQGVPYLFETFYMSYMAMLKQSFKKRFSYDLYNVLSKVLSANMIQGLGQKVYKGLHNMLGGNMRILVTGSAPMRKSVLKQYERAGLRIYEAYGINEVGLVSMNNPKAYKEGSVGRPYASKIIKIGPDKEILIKSDYNWGTSYINDTNNAGKGTFTEDGYVATGDMGYIDDDGFLFIEGRLKEVLVLSNGDKIHPSVIEDDLMSTKLFKQVVAVGDKKPFISCILVLENSNTPQERLAEAIKEINKGYSKEFKIKDYIIADGPFTVENGLMNSTLKINRNKVCEAYKTKLNKIYE